MNPATSTAGLAMFISVTVPIGKMPSRLQGRLLQCMSDSNCAASRAEPNAKPFVSALVVLPTASSASMVASAPPSPDISAMPAALSAIGPKPSRAKTMPITASIPIVAKVVP